MTELTITTAVPVGEIQGTILAAMTNENWVSVTWKPFKNYIMDLSRAAGQDIGFSLPLNINPAEAAALSINELKSIDIIVASTFYSNKDSIFKLIKFIQTSAQEKIGISPEMMPKSFERASFFRWNGIIFYVIRRKNETGDLEYMIIAGTDNGSQSFTAQNRVQTSS